MQRWRLIAYSPFGAPIGELTHPSEYAFSSPYSDVSAMTLSYRDDMPNANRMYLPCEVAVEYSATGAPGSWAEVPNARYLRIGRGRQLVGSDILRKYTMPGMAYLLGKARQWVTTGLNADNKRPFNAANVGMIMLTLINENKTFGGSMVGITCDFTTSVDSAGNAWDKNITGIAYEPGLDLFTILNNLSDQGMCDWYFQGRTLRIFNTSYLEVNKPVTFKAGVDINALPIDGSLDDMIHTAMVLGDAGVKLVQESSYSPPVYWGKWQGYIGNGGVSDTGTMGILVDQLLADGAAEKAQYTCELSTQTTSWEPFRDFIAGNFISAPSESGTNQNLRVYGINCNRKADGDLTVSLIVNDRFTEAEVKRARRTTGITGGATVGGSGTSPTIPAPGQRKPAAPTGLVAGGNVAPNAAGFPRAVASLDWADVTTDTGGVALEISGYEVQAYKGTTFTHWLPFPGIVGSSATSVADLDPGSIYNIRVRALSVAGVPSDWTTPNVILTNPSDTTPPGVPSNPTLSSALGTITIKWDGKAQGAANMPVDLDYVKVWQQGVTPVIDRIEPGGGYTTIGGLTPGTSYSFALSAIDKMGNESAKTSYFAITVVSAATDAGIQAQLGFLTTELQNYTDDQIATSATGNKITYSVNDPSGTGKAGDTWFKRNGSGQIIGQWEWTTSWQPRVLENAMFANLDAGKISFGEMDGLRIKAGTIRTDALAVGLGQNLIVDPAFVNATINAARTANGWTYNAGTRTFRSTTTGARFSLAAGGPTDPVANLIKVLPGEKWYLAAKANSTIANSVQFSVQGYDIDGSANASPTLSTAVAIPANTPVNCNVSFTVPNNMFYMNVGVILTVASASTDDISQPVVVKQTPAVLIQDGAVTATKLAVDSVTANSIAAGALDAFLITAPTIRTAASGNRVQLDATGVKLITGTSTLKVWMNPALAQMRFYNTTDLSHTSTGHALQMGDDDGANLAFDNNEIMARDAGDYGSLLINREGGNIAMGGKKGGFGGASDLGVFPADDDHAIQLRASVEIQNDSYGEANDLWSPLIIGARGKAHLWMDKISLGSADGAGGAAVIHINPPRNLGIGTITNHTVATYIGSDSIQIRRIGAAQGGVFCLDADVALQFTGGQVNARDNVLVGNRSMGASAFNVLSQGSTKKNISDIKGALDIVRGVSPKRWQFKKAINPEGRWQYGPILEDLPEDLHVTIGEDQLGYDLGSLVGILMAAIKELTAEVDALKG